MKAGWQLRTFNEVCELKKGRKPALNPTKGSDDLPYLSAKCLRGSEPSEFASTSDKNSICVSANEIIIICDGSNSGETFIGFGGVLSSTMAKVVHSPDLATRFLIYFLESLYEKFSAGKTGSAIPHLDLVALRAETLPTPPLSEQYRIVAILDEAFEGIATAKANAEKNLLNAQALFQSQLRSIFSQTSRTETHFSGDGRPLKSIVSVQPNNDEIVELEALNSDRATKTGGREATLRHIQGSYALSVCKPSTSPRNGWAWKALSELARLESGHTPSRRHPEYWGGDINWIGIKDARANHGGTIFETMQTTNELGIANSSSRVLPTGTVCLSRTASVGYVTVMGKPMATSQDFVNWVCGPQLIPEFLKYLFLAEGRDDLLKYGSGAVHQTIYFPEAKAFHVCVPDLAVQLELVQQFDSLKENVERLESICQQKITALEDLKKSLLHQAFTGQL